MPAFPPVALDDVEASNQRAFSAVNQARDQAFTTNMQSVAAASQRALDNAGFVSTQAQLGFLGLAQALGLGGQVGNSILTGREVRDQPNVSPTIAFVPSPLGAPNPAAASSTGTPAVTPSTPVGH